MDNYKAPKLKLNKRKMKPKAKKDSHYGGASMDTSEEKSELADIPIKGKIRIKKKKKKSGEGEVKFRKSKGGPKKMNIIDARAGTREAAKEALERGRLQQTRKRYKNIMKSLESIK